MDEAYFGLLIGPQVSSVVVVVATSMFLCVMGNPLENFCLNNFAVSITVFQCKGGRNPASTTTSGHQARDATRSLVHVCKCGKMSVCDELG